MVEMSTTLKSKKTHTDDNNGSISSVVTTMCVTAVLFVIIGITASYPYYDRIAHRIIWFIFICLSSMSLISIMIIFVMSKIRRSSWIASRENNSKIDLKCLFMWIFGMVVLADVLLSLTENIECVLENEDESNLYFTYVPVHILYIVYYITQNIFIHSFKNIKFYCQKTINYGILFIVLANITIGFSAYVGYHGIYHPMNISLAVNSSDAIIDNMCFVTSNAGRLHKTLKPYFIPCKIEYSFLVTYFMLSLWPSLVEMKQEIQGMSSISNQNNDTKVEPSENEDVPISSLNQSIQSVQDLPKESSPVSLLSDRSERFFISYGIVSNIILLIGSWMQMKYKSNMFDSHYSNYLFLFYKVYTFIILCMSFQVLSSRSDCNKKVRKITKSEYFLVFAGAGACAVCTFDMLVSLKIADGVDLAFVLTSIFSIFDIHYQTILILILRRCTITQIDRSVYIFLLLLAVANFFHWISDSFIDVAHFKRQRYIHLVFGKEIANFDHYGIFPILVYFRLISGIELIDIYRKETR